MVKVIESAEEFKTLINSGKVVVVDFFADWYDVQPNFGPFSLCVNLSRLSLCCGVFCLIGLSIGRTSHLPSIISTYFLHFLSLLLRVYVHSVRLSPFLAHT